MSMSTRRGLRDQIRSRYFPAWWMKPYPFLCLALSPTMTRKACSRLDPMCSRLPRGMCEGTGRGETAKRSHDRSKLNKEERKGGIEKKGKKNRVDSALAGKHPSRRPHWVRQYVDQPPNVIIHGRLVFLPSSFKGRFSVWYPCLPPQPEDHQ
ncbi:hypothetical protein BJX61DRAFT_101253 [Aspergillus egyptiacus]|nr:hypothetical protein BJX61DRAFT_101253 [Aspergillus egyptiacus]